MVLTSNPCAWFTAAPALFNLQLLFLFSGAFLLITSERCVVCKRIQRPQWRKNNKWWVKTTPLLHLCFKAWGRCSYITISECARAPRPSCCHLILSIDSSTKRIIVYKRNIQYQNVVLEINTKNSATTIFRSCVTVRLGIYFREKICIFLARLFPVSDLFISSSSSAAADQAPVIFIFFIKS